MVTFIYLTSFQAFSHQTFIEQLALYDRISDVILIDNSLQEDERNRFLGELEDLILDHVQYIINDTAQTFGSMANQYLPGCRDDVLCVLPQTKLSGSDIMEMKHIYDLSEHHAFVIPRTNDGQYQTTPVSNFLYPEETEKIYTREECLDMAESFEEYSWMPYVCGCCVLFDSTRVFDISGFNPEYFCVESALKEISIIVNHFGLNTVSANRAFAEMVNDVADGLQVHLDQARLGVRLGEDQTRLQQKYQDFYLAPEELFAERVYLAKQPAQRKRLLYDMEHLNGEYNGSAVMALNLLEGISKTRSEEWEICLLINEEAASFFHISDKYDFKISTSDNVKELFDIVFAPFQVYDSRNFKMLSRMGQKVVVWPLDLIIDRSGYLAPVKLLKIHEMAARYCDGLLFLSEETQKDYETYYRHVHNLNDIPKKVCYVPIQEFEECDAEEKLPFQDYFLVFGNTFLHKRINETIEILKQMRENFIIVGGKEDGKIAGNIYSYRSGGLSNELIASLYRNCKALLFPSIYEGYGLPVLQALNEGKNVYVLDTRLNHELESISEEFKGHLIYLKRLCDFPKALQEHRQEAGPQKGCYPITIESAGRVCWELLEQVLAEKPDFEKRKLLWSVL